LIFTRFFGERKLKAALKKEVDRLKEMSKTVLVGYPEKAGSYDDGTSIVSVAAAHEFGTDNIPKRPTLREGVDNARRDISEFITDQAELVISGDASPESVMDGVGAIAQASVQQEIVDLKYPPNTAETIKRKGSSNPLVDTGEMKGAVTFITTSEKQSEGI